MSQYFVGDSTHIQSASSASWSPSLLNPVGGNLILILLNLRAPQTFTLSYGGVTPELVAQAASDFPAAYLYAIRGTDQPAENESHTLSVGLNTATTGTVSVVKLAGISPASLVDFSSLVRTSVDNDVTSNELTTEITTPVDDCLLVDLITIRNTFNIPTQGADQTLIYSNFFDSPRAAAASYRVVGPAATYSMSWNWLAGSPNRRRTIVLALPLGEPAGDDVDSTLAATWPMFSVDANQSTVSAGVNSSIASTWPLFSVDASQDSAAPVYGSTVAATWPLFNVSAQQAATVPVYVSTAAMQWPMFTVQASQGAESPAIDSTVAVQWPMFTASANQVSVAPQYTSNAAITWPLFTVAANQAQELPAGATTVAVTWPMLTVSGSQASTVPVFTASVASTWPMFTVNAEQVQSFAGTGAVVDVTWPMFSASGSQSATVPQYSLTASVTWPMFSVQAFAGEFEYFTAPDARIDLPRLSRRADLPSLSRRIDL